MAAKEEQESLQASQLLEVPKDSEKHRRVLVGCLLPSSSSLSPHCQEEHWGGSKVLEIPED